MPQFILAFPLEKSINDNFSVTETTLITEGTNSLMLPGVGLMFKVIQKEHVAGLGEIFKGHQDILDEEATKIEEHKSLLFLVGEAKNIDEVSQVNNAILKFLDAGALGVYMQQSGAAWTANGFREALDDGEYPLDPWINFVEASDKLYTLGLATFALPDLSINEISEAAQETLLLCADAIFGDGIPAKSGSEISLDNAKYTLRQETKNPFPKDSPEFNRQGILKVVKK